MVKRIERLFSSFALLSADCVHKGIDGTNAARRNHREDLHPPPPSASITEAFLPLLFA